MNEILKRLYESLDAETNIENPFSSTEINRKTDRFLRNYFSGREERDKADRDLTDLQEEIQQKAFSAGFYAATALFIAK